MTTLIIGAALPDADLAVHQNRILEKHRDLTAQGSGQ
jgi:hypothetical protein